MKIELEVTEEDWISLDFMLNTASLPLLKVKPRFSDSFIAAAEEHKKRAGELSYQIHERVFLYEESNED